MCPCPVGHKTRLTTATARGRERLPVPAVSPLQAQPHHLAGPVRSARSASAFEPNFVERIASSVGEPYDLFVLLLGKLGPRYGEATALRRRSVNLLARRL